MKRIYSGLFGLAAVLGVSASAYAEGTGHAVALFAGGCFWSMEKALQETPGVTGAVSGYAGGTEPNPTYELVETGRTGYRETVRVEYDPAKISYAQLLDVYWHHIDPTDPRGEFCDKGPQYRAAIFVADDQQKAAAQASKAALEASHRFKSPITTEVLAAPAFFPAEEYHQDFYLKNPSHYAAYRIGCGRDVAMKALWGSEAPVH
jgi:peptide-methionine (S)-S-oxide reductase